VTVTVEATSRILEALSNSGLLLNQDKRLSNVVTLLTGEAVSKSWWSHPKGRLIFAVLSDLSEHPDVLFSKLLNGKVTLIHRKLWPAFLSTALANEPWQTRGLSTGGQQLLDSLNTSHGPIKSSGAAVKELEVRLLAHARQVHTESGRHELMVEPWTVWARRVGIKPLQSLSLAKEELEQAAQGIGAPRSALPWLSGERKKTSRL
jgi:hypothetical protein